MKKSQANFSFIVKAILALTVLIVVLFILGSKLNWFDKNTSTCESKGGTCSTNGLCDGPKIFSNDCAYYDSEGKIDQNRGSGQCCI